MFITSFKRVGGFELKRVSRGGPRDSPWMHLSSKHGRARAEMPSCTACAAWRGREDHDHAPGRNDKTEDLPRMTLGQVKIDELALWRMSIVIMIYRHD